MKSRQKLMQKLLGTGQLILVEHHKSGRCIKVILRTYTLSILEGETGRS